MTFFDYLKNIFLILIFLQLAPALVKNIKKQYIKFIIPKEKVAVIEVKGLLYKSNRYNKYLNKYFKDDSIKAILIKMDCAGGAAGTAQSIFTEIQILKKKYNKPVITLIENISASGGYYLATATDYIIAPASSLIGSIGASFQYLFQLHEFIEQYKIKYKSVAAGTYKNTTDPFIDMTPDQEKMLKGVLDSSYSQFAADVAKNRKLSLKDKEKWADGKIFTGNQALKLGLIDALGSPYLATTIIREKAMIEEDKEIEWVKPPKKDGFLGLFSGRDSDNSEDSMFSNFMTELCIFLENRYLKKQVV